MAPKLSLCINTYNEGADLLQTVLSFRAAYNGPFEAVIVDDGGTDDSAKYQGNSSSGIPELVQHVEQHWNPASETVAILRNEERVGCGKAKSQALDEATGDVILHVDGHCRVMTGTLNRSAEKALSEPCVIAPGVTPLHVPKDEQAAPESAWNERHTCWAGRLLMQDKGFTVHKPRSKLWTPKEEFEVRSATWYAVFMYSRETYDKRLGGWNLYPGTWGSQEVGLALRAGLAGLPIYATRDLICGHRYGASGLDKDWKKELKKRGIKAYYFNAKQTAANYMYAHRVVFDPETIEQVFRPRWEKCYPTEKTPDRLAKADIILQDCDVEAQGKAFRKHYKRVEDADFLKEHLGDDDMARLVGKKAPKKKAAKGEAIAPSDVTAVLLQYKRPVNQQRCVDALRAGGIENIWVWCQNGVKPPEGATRVFTDSENGRTWPRWAIASMVATPYVMHIDDDCELTPEGVKQLLRGAKQYPDRPVGLFGFGLTEPYNSYVKGRDYAWSHQIDADREVDVLYPSGKIWPRDLMQRVYGEAGLWQRMRQECNGVTRADDLIAYVALSMLGNKVPIVLKSTGKGVIEHFTSARKEDGGDRLEKQPEYRLKRATMPIWRKMGYQPLRLKKKSGESVFDERVEKYERLIGGKIKQHPEEVRALFELLNTRRPANMLEIGSEWGGTAYVYAGALQPQGRIVLVDSGTRFPARKHLKRTIELLHQEGFTVVWLRGNSHEEKIVEQAKVQMDGQPVEFLHIDGDHSEAGARADWENYGPLVAEGGLVAFHDIKHKSKGCYVYKTWEPLAASKEHKTEEIVKGEVPWRKGQTCGIGLVYK